MRGREPRDKRIPVVLALSALLIIVLNGEDTNIADPRVYQQLLYYTEGSLVLGSKMQEDGDSHYPLHGAILLFEKISVNRADARLLVTVPGIGKTLAERIIHERNENGPYYDGTDLMRVFGIGTKRSGKLMTHLHFD